MYVHSEIIKYQHSWLREVLHPRDPFDGFAAVQANEHVIVSPADVIPLFCAITVVTPVVDPNAELAINLGYTLGFLGLNIVLIAAFVILMRFVKKKIEIEAIDAKRLRPEGKK
jgi:hypothetical protein